MMVTMLHVPVPLQMSPSCNVVTLDCNLVSLQGCLTDNELLELLNAGPGCAAAASE